MAFIIGLLIGSIIVSFLAHIIRGLFIILDLIVMIFSKLLSLLPDSVTQWVRYRPMPEPGQPVVNGYYDENGKWHYPGTVSKGRRRREIVTDLCTLALIIAGMIAYYLFLW